MPSPQQPDRSALGGTVPTDHPMHDLVQRAYEVFDGPKPTKLGVCENCCMYAEVEADFLRPEIRALPLLYVQDWYCAAADQPVNRAIWRYLLPRILEILVAGEDPASVGIEVVFSRYPTGIPGEWTPAQWAVLDAFQSAFLPIPRDDALDDVLCMFANGGWPLDSLQEQVFAFPDTLLIKRLWRDWQGHSQLNIWQTAFWNGPSSMWSFYISDRLYERVSGIALAHETDPILASKAMDLATAIELARD